MTNTGKFKVWCEEYSEWERHEVMIACNGQIIHIRRGRVIPLRRVTHKVHWSTGLFDRRGVEIYDCDVIYWHNMRGGRISDIIYENNKGWHPRNLYNLDWWLNCKIIGNIHENPELLEEEQI